MRDGFIDRYTGEKLINPGMLKIVSEYFPDEFPYHKNGKMTDGHIAYWDLFPTIDHVVPIAAGGADGEENWVNTSMFNNSIKSNWTLEQLRWTLHMPGKSDEWDGLTNKFVALVEADKSLLNAPYIKNWYNAAKVHIDIPNEEITDEALII